MIGQFKGRQKTNVYGWVSDLAVARSGFNQIVHANENGCTSAIKKKTFLNNLYDMGLTTRIPIFLVCDQDSN